MEKTNRLFRKSRFGGFNKDDVIDYIEKMKNDFFEYKSDVEKTLSLLRKRVDELEKENEKLLADLANNRETEKAFDEAYPIDGIHEATDHLKMVADEICDNLIEFLDKLNDSAFTVSIENTPQNEKPQISSSDETQGKSEKKETVVSDILDSVLFKEKSVNEKNGKSDELLSVFPSYLFE